jgi:pyruvate kinase
MERRRTKIVATMGPSCREPDVLRGVIAAGADVVRLNLAHGTYDEHQAALAAARDAAASTDRVIGALADLPGPKMRTGPIAGGRIELHQGATVVLSGDGDGVEGTADRFPTTVEGLGALVEPGEEIFLSDGAIVVKVLDVDGGDVRARVERGGVLASLKGMHLPSSEGRIEAFTAEDERALDAACDMGVDYVGLSFVRDAEDVERARTHLKARRSQVQLVAKIETRSAIENLDQIVAAADAVMVARGDLGIQLPLRDVPFLQKRIIRQCNRLGRPVITATEMLESMTEAPLPTRAEVADVANAVLDGTDAVMLSAETAIGERPVEAVKVMHGIVSTADVQKATGRAASEAMHESIEDPVSWAIARAAVQAAEDLNVAAIVCPTRSGATAKRVSAFRPRMPILGVAHRPQAVGALAMYWGVTPAFIEFLPEVRLEQEGIRRAANAAVSTGLAQEGDLVAVVAGGPAPRAGSTDFVRIVRA